MREITADENAWEEGYAAGKKENMTKPTRSYEQMEYDVKMAKARIKRLQLIRAANQGTIAGVSKQLTEALARVAELEHVRAPGTWIHNIFTCPACGYTTADMHTASVINDMCNACPECDAALIIGDKRAWCNLQHPAGDCGWYTAEIVGVATPDPEIPAWQRGYKHGLAQCNHHPLAPEAWLYTREDHDDIEGAVDAIGEKISELQGILTAIETLR